MRVWEAIQEAKRVIPAEFDYVAPESLDEALAALRDGGEDAKLLAGGHSLLPLMKLRLAAPSLLVDLRRVPGLTRHLARERRRVADRRDDHATTRSRPAASASSSAAAATIADQQVRNRGHDRRLARARRPGLRPCRRSCSPARAR